MRTNKEKKKTYKRILKAQRKLGKQFKEKWLLFDFMGGVEILIKYLELMREYYQNGYNVMAEENKTGPTRAESLDQAIKAFHDFDLVEGRALIYRPTGRPEGYDSVLCDKSKDDWYEWLKTPAEIDNERTLYWNRLWETIKQYGREWWD